MQSTNEKVQLEVKSLYKSSYGKLVSSMLHFSGDIDLNHAEDLVQEAFSMALTHWKTNGIPINPLGWIYTVCKNKAINQLKKRNSIPIPKPLYDPELDFNESLFDDYQLRLLYACAHPGFSPKVQVIITLKYVVNFTVEAIAKIFGMSIDGVDKLLQRFRKKYKEEKILLKDPDPESLKKRTPVVHTIIYLIFNEGYKSSSGKKIIRKELCEEALLLNKSLWESNFGNKDTAALQALMLFNASRFEARFGQNGELLDLEEQDRSRWNQELIALGCRFLNEAKGGNISSFHYEASTAFLHCSSQSFALTDWKSISALYKKLLEKNNNPFIELNFAIALYYSGEKKLSFQMLKELQKNPFLNQYYLLNATLGKINLMEGDLNKAKNFFLKTLNQTSFEIEKKYIQKLIHKIEFMEANKAV